MGTPSADDLGARIIAIAKALAAGEDDAAAVLGTLVPTDSAARMGQAAAGIVSAAEALRDRAAQAAAEVAQVAAAQQARAQEELDTALARLAAERDRAVALADGAVAAADTALEQAKATGSDALGAATQTRDAAIAAAGTARTGALSAFDRAQQAAQRTFDEVRTTAVAAVADAEATAKKAADDATARIAQAPAEAKAMVERAVSAVAGLPDDVIGLGQDALAKLDGALTWPSGILSLVAKALIWLKQECFADVDQLQVVWQPADPGPLGIGLLWQQGADTLRILYRPGTGGAPDALVIRSTGAAEHTLSGDGISLVFRGPTDRMLTIGAGLAPGDPGPDGVSLEIALSRLRFTESFGPFAATADPPTLRVVLSSAAAWSYRATVALPRYGGSFRPAQLFAAAGVPMPISIPGIEEYRSLTLGISDGRAIVQEGAA